MERLRAAHKSWQYRLIADGDDDADSEPRQPRRYQRLLVQRVLIGMSLFIIVVLATVLISHRKFIIRLSLQPNRNHPLCTHPKARREWRSLSPQQQGTYISTVTCLMNQPSIFDARTSYYDDFIFAHSKTGSYSHYSATFLPWHRMYVHIYEQALREKCAYTGPMPYWDWTLDAHDISSSPIWSVSHGFGGDGDFSSPETSNGGRCVLDGPFANSTRAWSSLSEHDVGYNPHCLSRGFATNDPEISEQDIKYLHNLISPEYVQETLNQEDYESFFKMFEKGAHNAIPLLVRGDFWLFTAPNDPVFFLHHAQVDRLWWIWQQRDPSTRLNEFHGPTEDFRHHEHEVSSHPPSSLLDVMPNGGLNEDMRVQDVMDTQNGILCYTY